MTPRLRALLLCLLVVISLFAGVLLGRYLQARLPRASAKLPPGAPPSTPPGFFKPVAPPSDLKAVVNRFNELWYSSGTTWRDNRWMGIPTLQNPMDVWIIQELLVETKPDFVVEAGSYHGGSAAIWAMVLEQVNPKGRVITIDIEDMMKEARDLQIVRERVDFLLGSSTAPEIVADVARRVKGRSVLLVLDSLHTKDHVLNELRLYSPLVQPGGYVVVQDTHTNGHPVAPDFGPGPYEAVEEFLKGNPNFAVDRTRERLLSTCSPNGYLKRLK
jgi:cephalosporin hydroxylase